MSTFRTIALLAAALSCCEAEPIRLSPKNPHYFLFRGETIALITSGEHYGSVIDADFDYHKYLESLAAAGMNYTRLFGGSYREVAGQSFGIRRNTLAPVNGRYVAPWAQTAGGRYDLERWNPEFFRRYHEFLSEAARRGIVVEVSLFTSYYQDAQWAISPLNPANNVNGTSAIDWKKLHTLENGNILPYQERYVRKLVREANGFDNVIFEIQNEPWADRPRKAEVINPYLRMPGRDGYPNSIDVADGLSLAWQARVAEWISSEEQSLPNRHLVAQNYCNFVFSLRELLPGVGIVNFHYAYPEAVQWNYGLGKPISYDESGFLGNEDAVYRRQAWNFMLAGGGAFDGLDYSFTVGHEDGDDTQPNGPGGGSPALRRQLRVLREFLDKLPLQDIAPDRNVVEHASGVYARVLSSPGRIYGMYLDGGGPTEVTLNLPSGNYLAEWIDVSTGDIVRRERFLQAGGRKMLQSPRFRDGIALRLTKSKSQ
ncbi:MAG TPA: hypothetical protein VMT86_03685 [Bryobacteraceae bacterium]|nr:hypothetical protein [Bryobacteraceae bacterium]